MNLDNLNMLGLFSDPNANLRLIESLKTLDALNMNMIQQSGNSGNQIINDNPWNHVQNMALSPTQVV